MSRALALVGAAVLLLGAGAAVHRWLRAPGGSPLFTFASSIVFGIAACGVLGPIAALLGLPVPVATAVGLAALALAGAARRPSAGDARGDALTALLLAVPIVAVSIRALTLPMAFGDEIANWGYKSAAFLATGDIDPRTWSQAGSRGPSYPLSISVAGTVAAVLQGSFDPSSCRLVAVLAYAALAASFAECARASLGASARALATLGLACTPVVLAEAPQFMADTAFTAAIALAATTLSRAPASALGAAHLACVALLKIDGAPIAAAAALAVVACASAASRRGAALRLASFGLAANAPWLLLLGTRGVPALVADAAARVRDNPLFAPLPERVFGSLRAVASELVPHSWLPTFGVVAPALALLAFAGPDRASDPPTRRLGLAIAAAIVAGQIAAIALAPLPTPWHLEVVRTRTAMHLLPALALAAAAARSGRAPSRVP
ncbi:MAG TPA: hypothetical protein VKE69_11880 [Planctomycetota bacterium]|nr:hypothetical protein [Planctomycetota bacterium]